MQNNHNHSTIVLMKYVSIKYGFRQQVHIIFIRRTNPLCIFISFLFHCLHLQTRLPDVRRESVFRCHPIGPVALDESRITHNRLVCFHNSSSALNHQSSNPHYPSSLAQELWRSERQSGGHVVVPASRRPAQCRAGQLRV